MDSAGRSQQAGTRPAMPMVSRVGEGGMIAAPAPHILITVGLGSCVALAMYDVRRGVGGLAHVMLPSMPQAQFGGQMPFADVCVADTAVRKLIEALKHRGASLGDLVAKMAGGAAMFTPSDDEKYGIGLQNTICLRYQLMKAEIPVVAEDTGGNHGRSVELDLASGAFKVTSMGRADLFL